MISEVKMKLSMLGIASALVAGCSESNDAASSEAVDTRSATVAPELATVEAFVAHYNGITTRDPVDMQAAYALCYPENDVQRRYVAASSTMSPFAEFDRAMFEKFGEGFDKKRKKHMLSPDGAARLTSQEGDRAKAAFVDAEGDAQTLHLVRINDRWWVSGYSFEYMPQFKEYRESMSGLEALTADLSRAAPAITAKVRAGEFTSAESARQAFREAVMQARSRPNS